jgi:hypothetical protein
LSKVFARFSEGLGATEASSKQVFRKVLAHLLGLTREKERHRSLFPQVFEKKHAQKMLWPIKAKSVFRRRF